MTPDREQIRRDAERSKDFGVLCGHIETLLSELERAERERDEAHSDLRGAENRLIYATAHLAKVPALVEALRNFTQWDFDKEPIPLLDITRLVLREDKERGLVALAALEQE